MSTDGPQAKPDGARRIALLSDPHVYSLWVWPWSLIGKRVLGWSNLMLRRRHHFDDAAFARGLARAADEEADDIVVLGDLSQTALPSEFRRAAEILGPYEDRLRIIPGNHDRYTRVATWRRRMERHLGPLGAFASYPASVPLASGLRLIALDPCRPDPSAHGTMPAAQMEALRGLLEAARSASEVVLIACHYPVVVPPEVRDKPTHTLTNRPAVQELLGEFPDVPMIWANGHLHKVWAYQPESHPHLLSLNPGSVGFHSDKAPLGNGFLDLTWQPTVSPAGEPSGSVVVRAHRQDPAGTWRSMEMLAIEDMRALATPRAGAVRVGSAE